MEVREASVACDVLVATDADMVPVGYKRTEVGVIPEDWDLNPLGSLIASTDYGSSAKSHARGDVPVLRMGNLQDGKIDWNDLVYTSDEREIEKYKLSLGDVLFNRTNTVDLVGKTSIFDGERPAVFAGYLIRIKGRPSIIEPRFLNFALNAEFSRRFSAKVLSVAVSQANINAQKLRTYPIPTPTFSEQEAIAEALSDADALIESLEHLLAKKRQIKQGTMQELLTGKKRLPGFGGLWETTPLGSAAEIVMGQSPSSRSYNAKGIGLPLIQGNADVSNRKTIERVFTTESPKKGRRSDVLLSVRAPVGEVCLASSDVCLGRGVCAVQPVSIDREFLYHALIAAESLWAKLSKGSTFDSVNSEDVRAFTLAVPVGRSEQTAIATILSDMDAELAVLESRLAKTRQLKQGMMQELLIGRVRLVAPASMDASTC